jgi:hypothetical protein
MSATLEKARDIIRKNSPQTRFALKWKRLNQDVIVDESGVFYVGRVTVMGKISFEAWARPEKSAQAVCLRQNLPDGQSAKDWASSFALSYR